VAQDWVIRDASDLGRALAAERKHRGLRQEDLAEEAGLHRSYLSDLERGRATAQTERLFRVLRRLDLEIVVRRRTT
jgi:HTH-type transcriptional regulator / antitoxin HipB